MGGISRRIEGDEPVVFHGIVGGNAGDRVRVKEAANEVFEGWRFAGPSFRF